MGDKIVLSFLEKDRDHITHVGVELADHEVDPPVEPTDMARKEVIYLLKMDE